MKPQFGDIVTNGWASADNPNRTGFFVRTVKRTGRVNPGKFWEITDGKGKLWHACANEGHKMTVTRASSDEIWNEAIEAAATEIEDYQAFTKYAQEPLTAEMCAEIRALKRDT
ncbi:MAG: hypothetical protein ACPG4X_16940 [Pikeienuella sp.]